VKPHVPLLRQELGSCGFRFPGSLPASGLDHFGVVHLVWIVVPPSCCSSHFATTHLVGLTRRGSETGCRQHVSTAYGARSPGASLTRVCRGDDHEIQAGNRLRLAIENQAVEASQSHHEGM
jgi:hypothetical protein